ncbi:hypothetical protein, partial [Aquimonas sp.]|uniref:hypothetical protein n=1 Tax=Aquimonas sp. TaxID=1872588 RepID=UPI0037BE6B56
MGGRGQSFIASGTEHAALKISATRARIPARPRWQLLHIVLSPNHQPRECAMFRIFTTAAIAAAMLAFAAPSEAATTDSVFLLHGYNDKANSSGQGDAWDCTANWANQRNALRAYGHTGRVQAIGYYSDNKNCDRNLASTVYTKNFAGDAGVSRQGGPANIQLLTYDTSMTHVAYRFAWAAAREFLDSGRRIHVITDSLGGLIVRQAIAKSSLGDPDFPTLAQMQIMTVHTYGTPFYGAPAGSLSGTIQGVQARVGSGFINDLNSTAYTRVGSARWYSRNASTPLRQPVHQIAVIRSPEWRIRSCLRSRCFRVHWAGSRW